jgi:hypothetical protein
MAELQVDASDMREYEFYNVMVDQSLITKAPICMAVLGVKDVRARAHYVIDLRK